MRLTTVAVTALCAGLGLSGCGVTYVESAVREEAAGMAVSVVPVTPQTIARANATAYVPRALPAVFSQYAGGSGSGAPGLGALPVPPEIPNARGAAANELRVPPQVSRGEYTVGVGDVLRIATPQRAPSEFGAVTGGLEARAVPQTYQVRGDGSISLAEAGSIQVAGLTVEEIEGRIFERLVESGIEPEFSLEIAGFNSQKIAVGGAVSQPLILPLGFSDVTLVEALTLAGSIETPDPQFTTIRLYRDGTLYQIPLSDFQTRADLQRLALLNGDAVYVDLTYDLERAQSYYESQIAVIALRRESRAQALAEMQAEVALRRAALDERRALFTARDALDAVPRDYVYLAGEVSQQARWPLPFEQTATLADVLFGAGGLRLETGDPSQIYVLRDGGTVVEAWHLDASNAAAFVLATRFEMRPGDVVFVEQQPITVWNRAISQLIPTLISVSSAAG